MRASQWLITTLKETPSDADIISHQLMLRAGMIRKLGSGLYTWLPLGLKVLRKIEQIVREEMNQANAVEVLMPAVQPAELWQETGRWDSFGGQLLTMRDSNARDYCFGPTHEEVITDLIRKELQSYKQLPLNLYQIQTKFRDEIRPRFGVMRAREFIMKDAYSFHLDQNSLQKTYDTMYQTYCRIFQRMGLQFRAVEADTGTIGGSVSHEFQVLANSGEDLLFYSDSSDYAANVEQATSQIPAKASTTPAEQITLVDTPELKTINEVADFLHISPQQIVKTLLVEGENDPFVALILKGDDELNEIKASKHPLVKSPLRFIDTPHNQSPPFGFVGPVGLQAPIIVDHQALSLSSFVCGANQKDKHFLNVAWDRDAYYQEAYDLRTVKEGDPSPDGKGTLLSCRGIEVGHVFQLGDKYSRTMGATVSDETDQPQTLLMGCYGLGVSRVVAAAIEQHHDEKGIIWPTAIAPFEVIIIPINALKSNLIKEQTELLYQDLLRSKIDVLLDDRNERPGSLFADSDLMGIPHRLVLSEKNLIQGNVEYKARNQSESLLIPTSDLCQFLLKQLGRL